MEYRVLEGESLYPLGSVRIAPEQFNPRQSRVVWDVQRLVRCTGQYAKADWLRWASVVLEPFGELSEAEAFVSEVLKEELCAYCRQDH